MGHAHAPYLGRREEKCSICGLGMAVRESPHQRKAVEQLTGDATLVRGFCPLFHPYYL